ncbi:hypothetical protein GCM10023231_22320 [Olivibacter ginsenosidimutans]|uniref:WG repeat-containing protein n=1 Tax=Olivibacter ginsenosidimutans TaxID=1176537 RepID=A0ABP9BDX1_9SPHI
MSVWIPFFLFGQEKTLTLEEAAPFDGYFATIVYQHKKQLLHRSGSVMIDKVSLYTAEGPIICIKNGLYGVLDSVGMIIIPFEYDEIRDDYAQHGFVLQKNGGYGYADSIGRILTKKSYEEVAGLSHNTTAIKENGLWGWIDNKTGAVLMSTQYDAVSYEPENGKLIRIEKGEKVGLASEDGKVLVEPVYNFLYVVANQQQLPLFRFSDDAGSGLLDAQGKIVTAKRYNQIDVPPLSNAPLLLPVKDSLEQQGIINAQGKMLIEPKYDRIHAFIQGLAVVERDGQFGLINQQGKEIIPLRYSKIGYVYQQQNKGGNGMNNYDYPSMVEIPNPLSKKQRKKEIEDRIIAIIAENKAGIQVFNTDGSKQAAIDQFYLSITTFNGKTYLLVTKQGKQGLVDLVGNTIIPTIFDEIEIGTDTAFLKQPYFSPLGTHELLEGYARVTLAGKIGLYQVNGKELAKPLWDEIRWVNRCLLSVRADDQEGLIDTSGHIIRKPEEGKLFYVVANDRIVESYYDEAHDYRYFLTDLDGHILYQNPKWEYGGSYSDGYPIYREGLLKLNGFVNRNLFVDHEGKEVRFSTYDEVGSFYQGWADVKKQGQIGFIDRHGKSIVAAELKFEQQLNDSLLVFSKNGKRGLIKYGSLKPILDFEYDQIEQVYESNPLLLVITKSDKKGVCDLFGKWVLPFAYTDISTSYRGVFEIMLGSKKGIATLDGQVLIKPEYDEIDYDNGYSNGDNKFPVMVKSGTIWHYMDQMGKKLPFTITQKME